MDRVKVKRAALIERIEQRREEARAEHAKAKDQYSDTFARWLAKVEDHLVKALEKVQKGKDPRQGSGRWRSDRIDLPPAPDEPKTFSSKDFDRDISVLEMSEEETITVGLKDRWNRYL